MFRILKISKKSKARIGKIKTLHGEVETPVFMPIATAGAVKTLDTQELENLGFKIILANTYHLFLRPGLKVIKKFGGLHRFMTWPKAILTDSGGYQVFSLAKRLKISSLGVEFYSPFDGQKIFLSPEKSIEIQLKLGSDILMVLDECVGWPCTREKARQAVERTTHWAIRSKKEFSRRIKRSRLKVPLLFGIVQGSIYPDLRTESLKEITSLGFDGYAIGGLLVGESEQETFKIIKLVEKELPKDKPRYLMGAGYPEQIVRGVKCGIDMFDCVIPTREARHGRLYIFTQNDLKGKKFYQIIQIKNRKFKTDLRPLSPFCHCFTCRTYSRAYLYHLFKIKEFLAQRLATIHNLAFYATLIKKIREKIKNNHL